MPKDVPAAIFWSVTVYDPITGAGLENGQPFPSLNAMDKPVQNADGSFDISFGPQSPGAGKNWLATLPGKGWFTLFRLYGPKQAFFNQTWKPDDVVTLGAGPCRAMEQSTGGRVSRGNARFVRQLCTKNTIEFYGHIALPRNWGCSKQSLFCTAFHELPTKKGRP